MTAYLFLSYSRDDAAYVDRLVDHLATAGVPIWLGQHLDYSDQSVIHAQIDGSAGVIMVMSPAAQSSAWVARELNWAESRNIPIFPLLLSGEPFFRLIDHQYVDVSQSQMPPPAFITRLRNRLAVADAEAQVAAQAAAAQAQLAAAARARAAAADMTAVISPAKPRVPAPARKTLRLRLLPPPGSPERRRRVAFLAGAGTAFVMLTGALVGWLALPSDSTAATPNAARSSLGTGAQTTTPGLALSPGQTSGTPSAETTGAAVPAGSNRNSSGTHTTTGPAPTGNSSTSSSPTPMITGITLSLDVSQIVIGGTATAIVTVEWDTPGTTDVTITVDNTNAADAPGSITVNGGSPANFMVTGVGEGTCTVKVEAGNFSDLATLAVTA